MNGAEALVATAISTGLEVCFANPGTTELPLVMALDSVPGLRSILCLHENVATGAADGYGRMAGSRPCACFTWEWARQRPDELHNARRAFTPLLNVIGDHATWHLPADPLLATDVESLAHTVSDYVKKSHAATMVAFDLADAIAAAMSNGGCVATLIVPHDAQIGEAGDGIPVRRVRANKTYSTRRILQAAKALKSGKSALLLAAMRYWNLASCSRVGSLP